MTEGYTILKDSGRSDRPMLEPCTLAETLTRSERKALAEGTLVAVDEQTRAVLDESSPLPLGSVIRLRPPDPARDLADLRIPINRVGELVGFEEAQRIRAVEILTRSSFAERPLAEIRAEVARIESVVNAPKKEPALSSFKIVTVTAPTPTPGKKLIRRFFPKPLKKKYFPAPPKLQGAISNKAKQLNPNHSASRGTVLSGKASTGRGTAGRSGSAWGTRNSSTGRMETALGDSGDPKKKRA